MRLRNILFHLIMIAFAAAQLSAQNTNPEITNVNHSYNSGNGTITITYDIKDAEQSSATISMFVSSDGGTTWDYASTQLTGNVGTVSVSSTIMQKTIIWTHDIEHGGPPSGNNFIIKIIANDETAGGSPCPGTPTVYDPRDGGKTYNTIQIGDQCWLKENLDVGTRIAGSGNQTNNSTIEKYCYGDSDANCTTYGGLYQWDEAMQYSTSPGTQGICPDGWHLPTLAEFQTLRDAAGGSGNALKAVGQGGGSGTGTNASGFSALLAGYRHYNGNFYGLGNLAYFWSSTESSATNAGNLGLSTSNSSIYLGYGPKGNGFSVRCLKDS